MADKAATNAPADKEKDPVVYVCAVCLTEQPLSLHQPIMCNTCASEHGASKVFFKKRVRSTLYTTI